MLFWAITVQKLQFCPDEIILCFITKSENLHSIDHFFAIKVGTNCYHSVGCQKKNGYHVIQQNKEKLSFTKLWSSFWYFYHPRRRCFSNNIASLADVVHLAAQSFDNHNRLPEARHFSHTSTTHTASQIVGNRAIWSASKPKHVLLTYFKLPNKFSQK